MDTRADTATTMAAFPMHRGDGRSEQDLWIFSKLFSCGEMRFFLEDLDLEEFLLLVFECLVLVGGLVI